MIEEEEKEMPRILVVDDEAQFSYAASFALRSAGYQVTEASSGQEGLDMLLYKITDDQAYDLVLLDLIMPRMTGLQLIDKMKELKINSKILIITGVVEREIVRKVTARGCLDVMFKPFNAKELIQTVERILHQKASESASRIEFHNQEKLA